MKLEQHQPNRIVSGGTIGEKVDYRLVEGAKIIRLLSDTMYQDKIGSIVRELSCNAVDSHVEAGTPDKPFNIHVPNVLEPWFSVTDCGVGMSHEDIQWIYTGYGESTKDNTNSAIGAFGLGSKTPFAYTDQYTITSIYEGVKRVYVAVFDNVNMPGVTLHAEEETTEHNGMEITVSVEAGDFHKFEHAICNQLRFFPVKPTLTNNMAKISFVDFSTHIRTENDNVTILNQNSGVGAFYVVQGGVGYPLDVDKLGKLPKDHSKVIQAICASHGWVTMPIGSVGVTVNRENVSYDPTTCAAIIDALVKAGTSFSTDALEEIKKHDSIWERCAAYNSLLPIFRGAVSLDDSGTLFNGATLSHGAFHINLKKLHDTGFHAVGIKKKTHYRRGSYREEWKIERTHFNHTGDRWSEYTDLRPTNDMVIILKDTGKQPVRRMRKYMEDNNSPNIILIETTANGVVSSSTKLIADLLNCDKSKIVKMSDLEAPPLNTSNGSADIRPKCWEYRENASTYSTRYWSPVLDWGDYEDEDAVVYVPMTRHSPTGDRREMEQLLELFNIGKVPYPIVAVNEQTVNRINSAKNRLDVNFITVEDALTPILADLEQERTKYIAYGRLMSFVNGMELSTVGQMMNKEMFTGTQYAGVQRRLAILRKKLNAVQTATGDSTFNSMIRTFSSDKSLFATQNSVRKLNKRIMNSYPFLDHVSNYSLTRDTDLRKHAIEYMKLMDKA